MEKLLADDQFYKGHRSRMRAKLLAHGQRIFDTYELLEMLLYNVVPYKDTKPIAKQLLSLFGDLEGVFSASREDLMRVSGIGERASEFISLVGELSQIIGAELLPKESLASADYQSVGERLVHYFYGSEEKQVVAIFFDSSMRPIGVKKLYDLDYESGGVKAKAFVDEAIRRRSAVVVTAHNHPYGPFYPTPGDRETNTLVTEALAMAGVLHAEHYIVSGDSYAGMGSLKNFQSKLSQSTEVSEFMQASERSDGERFKVSSIDHAGVDTDKLLFGGYTDCFDYFVRLLSYCEGKGAEQTARAILSRYLTVENSFTASVGELKEICGEKCTAYLKLLAYVISRRETDKFKLGRSHNKREISDYLKALFLGESVEKIYLISFDGEGRTIAVNMLAEGTVNSSEITPRKAIETAIYASAASVSLAHNHPFGTTKPSRDDMDLTKHFTSLFATCDIRLLDHYIVAGQLCDTINIEL